MRIFVAVATLALAGASLAQDLSLKDALFGSGLKSKISLKDMPDTFRPVKVGAGETDTFTSLMPYMLLNSGPMGNNAMLINALQSNWTDGTVLNIEGQRFLVTYKLQMDIPTGRGGAMPPPPTDLALQLIRVDSIKSLSPDVSLTKEALVQYFTLSAVAPAEMAAVTAPAPSYQGAVQASEKTQTLSNLKQVALATIMYCTDYDDVYPYVQNTGTVQEVTYPYVKNREVWKTLNPKGGRFLFNLAIGGASAPQIENPAEMPMFYEERAWPDGSRAVAYADGHAKFVPASGWAAIQKELKKRYKRTGKPLPPVKGW
jgi:hypothetical protein